MAANASNLHHSGTSLSAQPSRHLRSDPEAHARGLALLKRLHGGHSGEQLVASVADICPDTHCALPERSSAHSPERANRPLLPFDRVLRALSQLDQRQAVAGQGQRQRCILQQHLFRRRQLGSRAQQLQLRHCRVARRSHPRVGAVHVAVH